VSREANVIAAAFSLSAFAVAVVAGMGARNPAASVLLNAVVAMVVCYALGRAAGAVIAHALGEHLAVYVKAHPVPVVELDVPVVDEAVDQGVVTAGVVDEKKS